MRSRICTYGIILALGLGAACPVTADERTLTPEQMEALTKGEELGVQPTSRPDNLPDLTKGELPPVTEDKPWTLGPTGIVGMWIGRFKGDQFQVKATLKGSPADGKFLPGDVLVGVNGEKFVAGGHLGVLIGNAIIEAEREANGGKISFQVWRDKNYVKRFGKKDVTGVDIDSLFAKARDDNSLYEWKPEEAREREVQGFDEFPVDPTAFEVELELRTFPDYSDTAPYDCPKTAMILEDAWKVLEKKFAADPKNPRSGRGGMLEAIALVASGKPEHRKLVRDWVRGPHAKQWHPPKEPAGTMFEPGYRGYKGYQSWHHGFTGLNCALYYEATGDEFVLPALRKYAIDAALGQSGGGSWGHTFAYPSFNGGEFHRMNPGYGALNAAGNRCFFLITLAKKLGVEHPEIDQAIGRAHRFFGSYVDQGAIPYGDHGAAATDDSNGKNTGIAFSMKLLGDKHGAKYFAMMSSHCAFTRRGGHGHDYHGNWSSWAASLCGPQVRIYNERNFRWRRTLCRMFDGSFVYHSPTWKYGALRDPTATEVLHQAVYLKQTLITGKDPDEDLYPTERELKQLMTSARAQFSDPWLKEIDGTPWKERATGELIDLLDIFKPKVRGIFARELARRYAEGEKEIVQSVLPLLESEEPRFRDGALRTLGACGNDVVLENLSKLVPLLSDPKDFVQITAVRVISKATDSEDTQLAMLEATVEEPEALSPNAVGNSSQHALFGKDNLLANTPFEAGFDEELVREALEELILLDPAHRHFTSSRLKVWEKDTIVRLAGPLTFAAEEEQIADQMFANRSQPAQALLGKFGYREGLHGTAHRLRKLAAIPRHIRPLVGFKRNLIDPDAVQQQPAAFREFIEPLGVVLTDNPLQSVEKLVGDKKTRIPLAKFYELIAATERPATLPSIAPDVQEMFQAKLDATDGTGAKIKLCRSELEDPARKNYFRKIAAMDFLTETLAEDALEDLLPYLGHDYWRLREHAQKLASELVTIGAEEALAEWFSRTSDPTHAAGILEVFADSEADAGLGLARSAMRNEHPQVRQAAVEALGVLGGDEALAEIFAHLGRASSPEDLRGCERALLSRCSDPTEAARVRDGAIALLPKAGEDVRPALYYLLAQIGDAASIATLKRASAVDSVAEFEQVVLALSYSPSREADRLLLEIAAGDKASAKVVGAQSVRRMVVGPGGFGDITNSQRLDFAEAMLKLHLDGRLISYLAFIPEARSLRALMYCLENGVESAAESLITCAEGMDKLSPADAKIAAKSLRDVIEYIEVTRLRGGPEAHMKKEDNYYGWKSLQARAGKVLLKVHQPEAAPIEGFDPLDLDL